MDVIKALEWRYAVKKFDSTKKLNKKQLNRVLDGLCLTATSMGLQLMEFLVIDSDELKKELTPIAYNQSQIEDCSHLIVMCRKNTVEEEDIDKIVDKTCELRSLKREDPKIQGYKNMLLESVKMNPAQQKIWMENQVYIAMGNLMTICAVEQVDACPMEGFNKGSLDGFLNLEKRGLKSVLLCALGFRSENDKYNGASKIRRDKTELISFID